MYSFCLFVCCSLLYSVLFPLIFAEPFLFTDFFSVLPSGTNSYSLCLARKKMIIIVEVVVVVGFNCV